MKFTSIDLASSKSRSCGVCLSIYLTTHTQTTLPIIHHLGFPVAILQFNLPLFRRENLKLIILHRIFRRNTVVTYSSVVKLWFTVRALARAVAPECPIPFSLRLWKRVHIFVSQDPFTKIKTTKFSLAMCKLRFNLALLHYLA